MNGEDVYDGQRVWCSLCQAEHPPCEYHDDGVEFWFFTPEELTDLKGIDEYY